VAKIDSSRRDFRWSLLAPLVFAGGIWGFLGRRRRDARGEDRAWILAAEALLPIAAILLVLTLSSCGGSGGGSSSTDGSPPPPPPPPPVTVSFTVPGASPPPAPTRG